MMKRVLIFVAVCFTLFAAVVGSLNYHINDSTKSLLYSDTTLVPFNKTGVLLGTSKYVKRGRINEFWQNRIEAASALYKSGKIKYLIISGDNSKAYYDEPTEMKKELVKSGIPDSVIFRDYAGFRTFDSMIRAYKIFGQTSFTVISQEFHNQRAVFIARHYGINAIGYNAKDVSAYYGFKTKVRELLARVKLYLDLMFDKQPKFLGEKIEIK